MMFALQHATELIEEFGLVDGLTINTRVDCTSWDCVCVYKVIFY